MYELEYFRHGITIVKFEVYIQPVNMSDFPFSNHAGNKL